MVNAIMVGTNTLMVYAIMVNAFKAWSETNVCTGGAGYRSGASTITLTRKVLEHVELRHTKHWHR